MRILICDDSKLTQQNLKDIMEDMGHEVVGLAMNGEEAVELFARVKPDVCFLDISMPGMDGIATLKKLREYNPDAKCIMCTGMTDQMSMLDAISGGALDFITKPYDEERIKASLAKVGL